MMPERSSPGLAPVVAAARGLRVAQRGATARLSESDLFVEAVGPVVPPASSPQEARLLDGTLWRRLWSLPDRLVIEFVDVAVVQVTEADGAVVFDRPLPSELEQHFLLDHVLPLVLARRGELVLHGSVLSHAGRAVVLVGPSGAGKSTLTAFAAASGWTVGGDDGAVVLLGVPVRVEPTYPTIRLTLTALDLLGLQPDEGDPIVGKRRLSQGGLGPFRQEPTALGLIGILEPVAKETPAAATRLRGVAAHVELFRSTFHADLGRGPLLGLVVDALAQLADTVPVVRLAVPRGRSGLAAAEAVLRREVLASPMSPGCR